MGKYLLMSKEGEKGRKIIEEMKAKMAIKTSQYAARISLDERERIESFCSGCEKNCADGTCKLFNMFDQAVRALTIKQCDRYTKNGIESIKIG